MKKLPIYFYIQDTLTVAKKLIGCFLVRKIYNKYIIGRINETEAYIGSIDKACHAYPNKLTKRTYPLFCRGGIAYIYLIYGIYYCLNVVTENKNIPAAVLIRGVEILDGVEQASINRYKLSYTSLSKYQLINLSNGPGKLCKCFDIDKRLNQESLLSENLFICNKINSRTKQVDKITENKRIGIDYAEEAKDFLWRFNG